MLLVDFCKEVALDSVERAVSLAEIDLDEFGHGHFLQPGEKTFCIELVEPFIESFFNLIFRFLVLIDWLLFWLLFHWSTIK
jgi:hypothetical protein